MAEKFRIAIVGAGPAGLSAAAHAAELGISHVLVEAAPNIANTVQRYQKGKLVMSEPANLPLRSPLRFVAGPRENVLETWRHQLADRPIRLMTGAAVSSIAGTRGAFRIGLASGEGLEAEFVVLAIGLQGNIRRLGVPGQDLPGVQYQLDDPEEYRDESIVVIGGGDSGVENALALAPRNRVLLINRQDEFTNCGEANFNRLREAIAAGLVETRVSTTVARIDAPEDGDHPLLLHLQSPLGTERVACHRVIARLGAIPPRAMLEQFGIRFPNDDPAAAPLLSEQYESNVPGLYVVGALAGYPLIKQALNQGFEVVEHILGNPVEPADQILLREKFSCIPGLDSVADGIGSIRNTLPLFASLTSPQLRQFMLDSAVLAPGAGQVVFAQNDYSNSFFSVLRGSVDIHVEKPDGKTAVFSVASGSFFGEMGLLSGRRRSGTVVAGENCVLVETPRRAMLRLLDAAPGVQRCLDEIALKRFVRNCYGASLPDGEVDRLIHQATLKRYAVGEVVFHEGDAADALYMIRSGSVTVSRQVDGKEVILAYVAAGNYVGEMALVSQTPRNATIRAAAPTELVRLDAERFKLLLDQNRTARSEVAGRYLERVRANEVAGSGKNSELIRFLMDQGVGEATDVLLIDYARCIRCDNCEAACADVHDGASRLRRDAGRTYAYIHVPASCRHCEHPRCMKDCPPDAIHRSPSGEVFISESCIGCGSCQRNCAYGVIQMVGKADFEPPSLLRLIFGLGREPLRGQVQADGAAKMAVKCDMCRGIIGGAACVRACPTGAAFRGSPEQFLAMSAGRQ